MVTINKNQVEIEVKEYKTKDKIKIIEDELLKIYKNAEEKAKELVVSYVFAKEERTKYQYGANIESQKRNAEKILNNAVNFVSRLKDIDKTLNKELVLIKLNKKSL